MPVHAEDKIGTVEYNEFRHGLSMLGFEPTDAQVKAPEIDFHTNFLYKMYGTIRY